MPTRFHLSTPRQLSLEEVHDIEAAWKEALERHQDAVTALRDIAPRFNLRITYAVVDPWPAC